MACPWGVLYLLDGFYADFSLDLLMKQVNGCVDGLTMRIGVVTVVMIECFLEYPAISRLWRRMLVTEKIDGTNGLIAIEDGILRVGSRTRWLDEQNDNYGFWRWSMDHREELLTLGDGRHYGEWWGKSIQRHYGLEERRFSLFDVSRFHLAGAEPRKIEKLDPRVERWTERLPSCCHLVPMLYDGLFSTDTIKTVAETLRIDGSRAALGWNQPEGIVIFHTAGNCGFKVTFDKDDGKWSAK